VYNHQRKNEQRYREQPDINVGDAHDDTYGNTAGYRHDDQQHHDYEDAGGYDDNYYLHEPVAARADDGYNGYSITQKRSSRITITATSNPAITDPAITDPATTDITIVTTSMATIHIMARSRVMRTTAI